nr:acyltransferase [Chitinophagaceae bacterium]
MRKIENFSVNNFNLARLVAALLVLITHGYELGGILASEPLYWLTHGRFRLSSVGLYLFFFTSGYLVCHSFFRTKKMGAFIWKRFLRIFPGLLVVVIITTFIIGPLFTNITLKEYFSSKLTYEYLLTGSGIYI